MALARSEIEMLRLVERSLKSANAEWADVHDNLWPFAQEIAKTMPELVELHPGRQAIRLTQDGITVLKYI